MTSAPASAYPLAWPDGVPRTKPWNRKRLPSKASFVKARDALLRSLELMGARLAVISSNADLRLDGLPRADFRTPEDPGVALYFSLDGAQHVIACDRWDTVTGNLRAIGLTVDALRGLERWGSSEMAKRAFGGFKALPPSPDAVPARPWREVLGLVGFNVVGMPAVGRAAVEAAFKTMAREVHPDTANGSHEAMVELNRARDEGLTEFGA